MVISQLDTILGVGSPWTRSAGAPLTQLFRVLGRVGDVQAAPLVLGVLVIAAAMLSARWSARLPAPLIGVVVAVLAANVFGLHELLLLGAGVLVFLAFAGIFIYYYVRFSRIIDARLSGDVFNNASLVFSAPTPVFVGEAITPDVVAARLRKGLYAQYEGGSKVGTYRLVGNRLEIHPGPASFFQGDEFKQGDAALDFLEWPHCCHHLAFRVRPAFELQPRAGSYHHAV